MARSPYAAANIALFPVISPHSLLDDLASIPAPEIQEDPLMKSDNQAIAGSEGTKLYEEKSFTVYMLYM